MEANEAVAVVAAGMARVMTTLAMGSDGMVVDITVGAITATVAAATLAQL